MANHQRDILQVIREYQKEYPYGVMRDDGISSAINASLADIRIYLEQMKSQGWVEITTDVTGHMTARLTSAGVGIATDESKNQE